MLIPTLAGATIGSPDGSFVIAEWTDPGCPADGPMPVAPLHLHRDCDEAWYVLEGTLCFQVGDEQHEASSGGAVVVPKGTPHTYWNPQPEPARYLLVMTSKTFRLIEAIHASAPREPEAMRRIFEEHDAVLLEG